MLVPPSANPQAPPPMPDMALIGQLGTYGVQIMSGQGLDALKVSSTGDVESLYTYLLETDEDTFSTSLYVDENDLISAMQVRITTSAGTSGAAQIRDDLYTAFEPLSDLGIFVGVTSDNIVTESVNELINSSQFQSLVFAILASMIFLVLYYLIDMRRPFLGVITVLPVAAIVKTFNTLQDEFGGGFGETTSVLIESDNVATPEIHNALIDSLSNLSDVENVLVFAGNAAAESVVGSLGAMLVPPSANPQAPPPMPDMALIGQLGTYGVQIMSGQGLDALKVSSTGDVESLYTYLLETDEDTFSTSLYVDENDLISAMQVRITTSAGTSGAAQIRDDLYTAFEPLSDLGIFVGVTSDNIVTESVNELINSSQFQSLVFAILASMIFLVLYYLIDMRRPFLGVITVLPVAAIVLGTYMGMYLLDIPLNPVTSTLSGLAIGIGVPFVIHVTNRFRETISSGIEPVEAIRTTLKTTGGSLFGSAFTTMAGFGILTTSSLVPFQQMGTVILVSIGFALIASLMILPTFLVIWANYHNRKTAKTL